MPRNTALIVSVLMLASVGCSASNSLPSGHDSGLADAGPMTVDSGVATVDADIDAFRPVPARFEVSPASFVATAALDEILTQDFEVTYIDGLGVRTPVADADLELTIDDPRIGTIDPTGHFVSGARSAGAAQLTILVITHSRNLYVPIEITRHDTLVAGAAAAADAAHFDTLVTDDAAEAGVVYPLDGVVMPQDVFPPDVQWTRGAVSDTYRFRFTLPHVSIDVLYRESSPQRRAWLIDAPLWRLLAQADPGANVEMRVDRFDAAAGRAIEGAPLTMRFAPGVLRGLVYYWDASSSTIQRIEHGSGTREQFAGRGRCVGCHTIAPDGRTVAVRFDGADGPGGVIDADTGVARDLAARWYFASFAPSGDRLIVDTAGMSLELVDMGTGAYVPGAAAMLPRGRSANPAWSPDGRQIAYVANIDVNYRPGFDSFQDGDLALLPVTGPDTFGTPSIAVDASTIESPTLAPYRAINQPTWAPDSKMLVFAAGPYSNTSWANALYSVGVTGGVVSSPVRLDRAMGGPARVFTDVDRGGCTFPPTDATCCHNVYGGAFSTDDGVCVMSETDRDGSPRFAPFYQGGYFWLVFSSRRAYGNELAGTPRGGGVGAGRPQSVSQLWVAAINPGAEFDPSAAGYWLPGQDRMTSNIDAQWAPEVCVDTGEACGVDGDCCSGVCGASGVCTTPPPERCHGTGETCSEASDCCGGLLCTGRLCSSPLI